MFVGNVDVAQRDRIAGWAADTDFPNGTIEVVILVAGREVGRARADRLRQDLRDLGPYGDGRHGFDFTFDELLPADEDHDVAVRFAASGQPLGHGEFRLPRQACSVWSGSHATAGSDAPGPGSRPTARPPRYVIHIGMPKTGTKYLQQSFCLLKDRMLADGICYPSEFWPKLEIFAHHELLKELLHIPNPKLEGVFAQLSRSGHKTILLSCEGFIGVSKETLEYLRTLIGASEVRIVFYARRWSDWIPSQWQQTVKQGETETFPEMYARTLATAVGDHGINYNIILDKFADVFGHDSIQIVPYSSLLDRGQDISVQFVRDVLGWNHDVVARQDRVHESMGIFLTELMRCMNVLETARSGSSGYHVFQSLNSLRNDPHVRADVERIFGLMQGHEAEIAVDDNCYPLRSIFTQINERYAGRLLDRNTDKEIFARRKNMVRFIRPDFLLGEGASSAVHRIYAAVAQRAADGLTRSAA
jgi:hypothetical protein